jgi:hypothetical protein
MDPTTEALFIPEKPPAHLHFGKSGTDVVRLHEGQATFALSGYVVRTVVKKPEPARRGKAKK